MSSIPNQHNDQGAHDNQSWRVILVGRTGLDQILRRESSVELIRARDTIDAIGELSDPIDFASPADAVVIVAAAAQPERTELTNFITSLRLVDPQVRVLRVGSKDSTNDLWDGAVEPGAGLNQILDAISKATPVGELISLRFVDHEPETVSTPEPAESTTKPISKPEVVVVAKNEDYEKQAQESEAFEEESELHKQVLLGTEQSTQTQSRQAIEPMHNSMQNDEALVQAMVAGRSVLELAIECINARLGRDDISFSAEADAVGLPIMLGQQSMGKLICKDQSWAMGDGHDAITKHGHWLAGWIKLEVQQTELRNAAFTDPLTGAWNRRYFTRYLDAAIVQSRVARQPLTVMLFDIDGFKHYNDAYGHAAGDEILVETVKLLKSVIRPSDRVCRVGGDEFVVIFYEPNGPRGPESKPLESVYQIATRFQRQICAHRFPKLAGEAQGTLTVSGGLASFPWDGHNSETLLEQADQLAMESKRNGKNAMTLGPGAESICKHKP